MDFNEFRKSCKWCTELKKGHKQNFICGLNADSSYNYRCAEVNCGLYSVYKNLNGDITISKKWDSRFIALAKYISNWSKDPSTKVGCVIADENYRIVSIGFNGFPQGVPDEENNLNDRTQKYPRTLHAEANAILFARRNLINCSLYVYPLPPCEQCAALIIQSGCTRVLTVEPEDKEAKKRWDDTITRDMFSKAKRKVTLIVLEEA